jgi:hypothetical protein
MTKRRVTPSANPPYGLRVGVSISWNVARRANAPLRLETNLLKPINVIWAVQSLSQKYFCFSEFQIKLYDLPSRPTERGVGHRHERWGGERWTRQCPRAAAIAGRVLSIRERCPGRADERHCGVRQNRVVLTPQRLASSLAEVLRAQPGGQNHIREATVSNKPDRRGEHDISVKTIAQGMPDCLR